MRKYKAVAFPIESRPRSASLAHILRPNTATQDRIVIMINSVAVIPISPFGLLVICLLHNPKLGASDYFWDLEKTAVTAQRQFGKPILDAATFLVNIRLCQDK